MINPPVSEISSSPVFFGAIVVGPLLLLAVSLFPASKLNRNGTRAGRVIGGLAMAAFAASLVAVVCRVFLGSVGFSVNLPGPVGLDFYFDTLSAIMLVLVSFLGAVVTRFSLAYLAGDPQQGRFFKWLSVTIGSVLTLIISGNLLMFTLAWVATSLSLHRLLTFYPDRPAAMLAARKKFLISRLGDACLAGALILTWQCFGTWEFSGIFSAVEGLRAGGGEMPACLGWSSLLLVTGALLKSAQFPFHSWLPDTMETPTPVSALMHAGIINAGGFLIVRLSPIVASAPAALNALALCGAFTALFASVVMLTQTSVKRSLAYSTVAQMGFMMLQCGLGAFSLAVLHLVAHSLYKAHAFLSSGSIVSLRRSSWVTTERISSHPAIVAGTLLAAVVLVLATGSLFGLSFRSDPGVLLLGSVFLMALAYLMWNLWASTPGGSMILPGLFIGVGATLMYFSLHAIFEALLDSSVSQYAPERSPLEALVMGLIVALFMAVLVLQSQLPAWSATKWGQTFYAHASRGFYLGTLASRFTEFVYRKRTA